MRSLAIVCAVVLGPVLLLPAAPVAQAASAKAPASAEKAMLARVEARIADLHAKLHITAAEEPQWRPFAQQMLAGARKMEEKLTERGHRFRSLNAVENMQSYAGIAAQHAENMQQLVPLFEALYKTLSPQQQHVADEVWRGYAARGQHRRHSRG